ncbi:MAG TPA: TonB-dependent receptor [Candidatus Acidoferrales bacterium]|nr:TonB-dependent receptor [Candidatus Acidoferrales bacterium]
MSSSRTRKSSDKLKKIAAFLFPVCLAALVAFPQTASSQSTGAPPATPAAAPQQSAAPQEPAQPASGKISGVVKSGNTPIPGATVLAANFDSRKRAVTTTDINGNFLFTGLASGRYFIAVQMIAFAPGRGMTQLDAKNQSARVDIDLTLASRVPPEQQGQFGAGAGRNGRPGAGLQGGAGQPGAPPQGFPAGAEDLSQMAGGAAAGAGETGEDTSAASQGVPGMQGAAADTATESVATTGNMSGGQMRGMSSAEIQSRVQEFQQQRDFMGGGQFRGGPGGRGGEGGGPIIMFRGGGRRGFDQPHGALFYTLGDSALNASPYSLTGAPVTKPSFVQHNFGATLGGPLNIPKIYKGGFKNFFFASYNGTLSQSPFDQFSTVPTAAERGGDFSALGSPIFDPATGNPDGTNRTQFVSFPTGTDANSLCTNSSGCPNMIPASRIATQSAALMTFIPNAGLPGAVQNFHFVTTTTNNSNSLNFRLIHNFGASSTAMPFGRRGGIRNSLNVGFNYRGSKSELTNPFPGLGGNTTTRSFNIPAGFSHTFSNKLTNMARFDFNRSRSQTQNLFAFVSSVAGLAGIGGISPNPFDWGAPNLSFSDFSGVSDAAPALNRSQTFTYSDTMALTVGKHTLRWGADFRRIQINTETSSDPRGSFTFSNFNTANITIQTVGGQPAPVPQPGTGFDFADFLLGLPQQTSIQCGSNSTGGCVGPGNYHFRGNSWDLFLQDDWHMRGNFTLNFGLRYEYVSPFIETANQLANLDIAPGFTAIAPVQPGQTGPFTGAFPKTLVNPDRDNIAPRLGVAWKPLKSTVVRSGYGINYNTGAYNSIVQQLAFQPPFSLTERNIESSSTPLTLASGFPAPASGTITNSYAVNRNYQLGYVQIWNLDVQQELSKSLLLNVDYTGSKGTNLDILEDPNRSATGLLIPNTQPFNLETAEGDSILHAGTVRLRKRLSSGVSVGGTYTYSKSIDNASSIGGGGSTVAQNAFDLAAERGVSSFDQRHRFTGDYLFELPLGPDRRWLAQKGVRQAFFGGWEWSGDWTISSGLPFTANVKGNTTEISRGTNGTLRADSTGQPVALSHPTTAEWFNTAAFQPPAGPFGNVGRNTIRGPGALVWDMAMTKVVPFGESRMLEIRAQADNVFNRPQFSGIDTTLGTFAFGQVTSVGSMRTIQIVTRFRF